jgi:hypothetical protein
MLVGGTPTAGGADRELTRNIPVEARRVDWATPSTTTVLALFATEVAARITSQAGGK